MKFTLILAAIVCTSQAIMLQKNTPETGDIIPICNGANSNNCTEADVVVVHRAIRPHKVPSPAA